MLDITNISDMTTEQLADLIKDAAGQISDLEAERDSLKQENQTLKDEQKKTGEELQSVKKLNFTLARTLDTTKGRETSVEETLHNMFKERM